MTLPPAKWFAPDAQVTHPIGSFFGLYRATPAGELLGANDELARIYGLASVLELHRAAGDSSFEFYAHAGARSHFLGALNASGRVRGLESLIRRHDGSLAWIRESATAQRDSAGEILFIEGVVEDITDAKLRESERHDSEEKLRTLIGSVEDCLWSVDTGFRLITFNAPFIRMFVELTGYVLKAGDLLTDLIPTDWREEELAFYRRALGGERFVVEQRYMSFTGERFYELSFNPIHGSEGIGGVAVISKDSTERHRTQVELKLAKSAAESASRLKSEFLANMSHEIRTPMNGIMGMTDLLLRTTLAPHQREFVNTMRVSGESLLTVINDILDFSKIEAGKLQFENIGFDLHEIVENTLDLFATPALAKNLEIGALINPGVATSLRGDPGRLRQVINNLFSNAIKFTETGEVVLSVAPVREEASRVVLEFKVRDTGIGVDEAAQAHLFEAFSQADGSMARKYGGTGLGLAISRRLVALMNGDIRVQSAAGQGSVFSFVAEFDKGSAETPAPRLDSLSALVVSDNPWGTRLLDECLAGWKMSVRHASNLASAWLTLGELKKVGAPLHAILLDLRGGAEAVLDALPTLRAATHPAPCHLVVLTSLSQPDLVRASAGGVHLLPKPIKQARLAALLGGAPTDSPTDHNPATPATPAPAPGNPASALRVLLAEDNLINQKVACGILRTMGLTATIAANGQEVIAALQAAPYDVILMDCQMPVMDGFEATRHVRAMAMRQPLIIAMTANALPGDRERCLASGMNDYITKPIRAEILREKLLVLA